MKSINSTSKPDGLPLYISVGAIGAGMQAYVLHHLLVHTYPFKITPVGNYDKVGVIGGILAPLIAIVCATLLRKGKRPYLLTAIPVVLCPLLFVLIMDCFYWFSPDSAADWLKPQFDDVSGADANSHFAGIAFALSAAGLVILMCGIAISFIVGVGNGLRCRLP